jgi:hypothetical protein
MNTLVTLLDRPIIAPAVAIDPVAAERRAVAREYGRWLRRTLRRQVLDRASGDDGAFDEHHHGWYDGRWTAFVLAKLVAARCWAAEIGIQPGLLDEPIRRALGFVCRRQNERGELDLGGSYSPNEVGFAMPGLAEAYRRLCDEPELSDCLPPLRHFLLRGAEAVLNGDAHTANHRWTAACAPLAAVHSLWPDPRYLARIHSYLADGIDCDADGLWYHERCPGYSDVANHGLIAVADALGRPELLEHVVRNCQLAMHLIQPNNEADSSFSLRQTRSAGNVRVRSYLVARRAAIESGDGRLTALAELCARVSSLACDMLYPLPFAIDATPGPLPRSVSLPAEYDVHMQAAQVARRRRGSTALTVSADAGGHFYDTVRDQWGGARRSDDWLHLHHGPIVIQSVHLAIAHAQNLQPDRLEVVGGGHYRLTGRRTGWEHELHFRPGRPKVHVEWNLEHAIEIQHLEDRIRLSIRATSSRALAASLRIYVRPGVTLTGGGVPANTQVQPGITYDLAGGASPLLMSAGRHQVSLLGLPPARHRMPIVHPEPIPSAKPAACGVLSLGLTLPVSLDLELVLATGAAEPTSPRNTVTKGTMS